MIIQYKFEVIGEERRRRSHLAYIERMGQVIVVPPAYPHFELAKAEERRVQRKQEAAQLRAYIAAKKVESEITEKKLKAEKEKKKPRAETHRQKVARLARSLWQKWMRSMCQNMYQVYLNNLTPISRKV